jgi:hypothetical protein
MSHKECNANSRMGTRMPQGINVTGGAVRSPIVRNLAAMHGIRWVDRTFSFGLDTGLLPATLERLRGAPVRLADMLRSVPDDRLSTGPSGKWSIKEHIGHLIDLETGLHAPRLDDFRTRTTVLRPWDGTNRMTSEAGYSIRQADKLIDRFGGIRRHFVDRLISLPEDVHRHQALHPRLGVMMRPVDMAFFVAEHDDHHLAAIRGILDQP